MFQINYHHTSSCNALLLLLVHIFTRLALIAEIHAVTNYHAVFSRYKLIRYLLSYTSSRNELLLSLCHFQICPRHRITRDYQLPLVPQYELSYPISFNFAESRRFHLTICKTSRFVRYAPKTRSENSKGSFPRDVKKATV